jgi:histidinol-phosphate phosphatase family protein
MKQAFVIFDRDGTLIDHVHHLVNPDLVQLKKDLGFALQILKEANFKFGVISNQSVIARGLSSSSEVELVNSVIINYLIELGIVVDFFYYCPHLESDNCTCRKPKIGFGEKAIFEHNLDPAVSFMVGDQESDILFGKNLGCKTVQVWGDAAKSQFADYYSDTLESAARWILGEKNRKGS